MAAPKTTTPTVLFQAPNSIGLGHINRLATIALALREAQPATSCVFAVTGSDHGLLRALGLPALSLPATPELASGPVWSAVLPAIRQRLLVKLADAVIDSVQPTTIVFDSWPDTGVLGAAVRRQIPFCFVARKMKSLHSYMSELRQVLDRAGAIIVPHEQADFQFPRPWENKTHYVGTIVRRQRGAADPVDMGQLPEPRIVITGGGGGYPGTSAFYNLAVAACRRSRDVFPTLSPLVIAGPLFREWNALRIGDAVLVPSHWDMRGLFEQATLVICQAGYNTLAELVHSGAPAISVPAERSLDDQADRARLVASRLPRFRVLENPTVEGLSACVSAMLAAGPGDRVGDAGTSSADGARLAAKVVADLIHASVGRTP